MVRLEALVPDSATGKTKELFNTIAGKFGGVSNMMRGMGNSPAFLEGFLNFFGSLSKGKLGAKTGTLLSLTIAEANACHYCLAAHTYIGATFNKLDIDTIKLARRGASQDPRTDAILKFALALVNKGGRVSDQDVASIRAVGVTDEEITEIVGHVGLNILTNYFNNTAGTEIDIPA